MKRKKWFLLSGSLFLLAFVAEGQQVKTVDLFQLAADKKLRTVHRNIEPLEDGRYRGIRLSADSSEGLVWLPGTHFSSGSIEFDTRGKDEFQRSFIGIAFYGQNDSTFDAIYFRPFNFHAKDSVRRIHAVQYVSHPVYTWKKLREDKTTNAQFEKAVADPPDPNDWFHVKVELKNKEVTVFINNRHQPELVVYQLCNYSDGQVGLFAGDGSGGDFANVIIK